jgi:hypothetical protein
VEKWRETQIFFETLRYDTAEWLHDFHVIIVNSGGKKQYMIHWNWYVGIYHVRISMMVPKSCVQNKQGYADV